MNTPPPGACTEGAEVWLLRHFEAAGTATGSTDAERPLTATGRADALAMGSRLATQGLRPRRILCSPLLRTRQTAQGVGSTVGHGVEVDVDGRLAPGGDIHELVRVVVAEGCLPVLLVGHNPDLEEIAFSLTGRGVPFRKGTLVRIAPGQGERSLVEVIEPAARRS